MPSIGLAESQGGGLPQMDISSFPSQLFWLVITFGALYLFMWKNAVPKLRNTIEERHDKIAIDLNEAEKIKSSAEKVLKEYEHKMSSASKEASNIINNAKIKADTMLENIKKDQEKKLNDALDSTRIKIKQQEIDLRAMDLQRKAEETKFRADKENQRASDRLMFDYDRLEQQDDQSDDRLQVAREKMNKK